MKKVCAFSCRSGEKELEFRVEIQAELFELCQCKTFKNYPADPYLIKVFEMDQKCHLRYI